MKYPTDTFELIKYNFLQISQWDIESIFIFVYQGPAFYSFSLDKSPIINEADEIQSLFLSSTIFPVQCL